MSVTYTLPSDATAAPRGEKNCPSPVPAVPHLLTNTPVAVNFWIKRKPPTITVGGFVLNQMVTNFFTARFVVPNVRIELTRSHPNNQF